MSELDYAAAALEVLQQVIGGVDDAHLDARTPCREYDVAALAEHLVDSVTRISAAARVTFAASTDPQVTRRVVDTGRAAVSGWRRRGVDGAVTFGGRSLAAGDLLGVIALEFVVHGWDLATAVGTSARVPDDLADDLLRLAHRTVTPQSRRVAGFDQPVTVADDATPLDRLLAFTGRDPAALFPLR